MTETCLSTSRFIAFFDECGDHSLTKINPQWPIFLLCMVVVESYKTRYEDKARNPYDVALEYNFERVLCFLESQNETALPVIAEARGKLEDDELRASFYKLMTKGTYYHRAACFRLLDCPISFRRKNDNIAGIQLADLCAYPVARHVLRPDEVNRPFDVVRPHFYRNGGVYGLKVFPK